MKESQEEAGFSYIETMIAIIVLTVGILGSLSALSYGVMSVSESEKRTKAKEIAGSTMETIFAVRDMVEDGAITSWEKIGVTAGAGPGIFLDGWTTIRENPGQDGIYGTADDACAPTGNCVVGAYINTSDVVRNFQRKVEIVDIVENSVVKKRRLTVRVRYAVGSLYREENLSTIIANMPFN